MPRILKQITYGIFYLAILTALGFGGYLLLLKPPASCVDQIQNQNETGVDCGGLPGQGGCVSCEIKQLTPIVLGKAMLLRSGDIVTVVAPMENLNLIYGAQQLQYALKLIDNSGQIIKTISKTSFIHAGEKTQFVETGIADARQQIARAEITIANINWQPTEGWWQPALTIKEIQTNVGQQQTTVQGIVANTNNFIVTQVVLRALVADSFGAIVGASKTTLETLQPFEERTFQINIVPDSALLNSVVPEATELFVSARK
ncbi:MAG TPA: FxLYD domain-containing protein [Candidatus Paceibacterota bacterium]